MSGGWVGPRSRFQKAGVEGAGLTRAHGVMYMEQLGTVLLLWTGGRLKANVDVKARWLDYVAPGFKFCILAVECIALMSVDLGTNSESTLQDLKQTVMSYTITSFLTCYNLNKLTKLTFRRLMSTIVDVPHR